jgi:hypothetical protein
LRPRVAVFACLLLASALAACGTADRESEVAAVTERFHAAVEARDGRAACAELSEETASKLEQQERKPCSEAVLALKLSNGGSVRATGVYVQSAYADLDQGGTDFLSRGPEGWTISAAGCRPKGAGQPCWWHYVGTADFWNQTLQNWQSEFLAIGSMAILAVYLRQRGSPESKPVGAPHDSTGVEG